MPRTLGQIASSLLGLEAELHFVIPYFTSGFDSSFIEIYSG
jgi:hypothetical protein